ncbi:MAG: D-arabinose 5-phosphate isomerase [Deltaproteobacteria bacterium GWA2_47_9]|nr:MAG: D-arabinose 5-phosphate isomerase [Deltaproteobacteria bacterium GWA2_47_9]
MVIEQAKKVLKIEAEAISFLIERIDDSFVKAVDLVFFCKGKIVVTGVGKSGLIGQKIASTLASTGTPSFFMHPAEGIHGDLGMLSKNDVVIAISNSGESNEISQIIPVVKRMGLPLISMTGNRSSTLAKSGDAVLDISVKEEACPLGLAPTASTTATLAMGDALAVAVLDKRGFNKEDFALLHPGGSLGKRLLVRVSDLMHTGEAIPLVTENTVMKVALFEITSKRLGVTGVLDDEGFLEGAITDGDLRRAMEKGLDVLNKNASEIMTRNPKKIGADALAAEALQKMEQHSITSLFVMDGEKVAGIVHLHDLLKAGVV